MLCVTAPHRLVVLDEEDALVAAQRGFVLRGLELQFWLGHLGQQDGEGGAVAEVAEAPDGATGIF